MKTVKLSRAAATPDECRRYSLRDDPQDCYGLTIGSIDKYQNQAELNVGSTQQTFVHSLTGFQNGTLNIDAGGNVTVNEGSLLAPSKVLVSSPLRKTAAMCWRERRRWR